MSKFEPLFEGPHDKGGLHQLYRFPSGFGASVAPDLPGGEGRELAVIRWRADVRGPNDWDFVHGNPVTGSADVVMRIGAGDVEEVLEEISRMTEADVEAERAREAAYQRRLRGDDDE